MPKSEGAAIPMQSNLDHLCFLVGHADAIRRMVGTPALPAFSEPVIRFLDELSRSLMSHALSKVYPEVVTFAFWIRRASIEEQRKQYGTMPFRIGRGVAFHVAPSNVPVNFAYSLVVGLLAGNANVVRVPSKDYPQVDLIADAISEALSANPEMKDRICLVKYGHEKSVTDELSFLCDARIIWGGDETIKTIRKSPLPPRAIEITFADRYSFALIDADAYLLLDSVQVAQAFFNDTYLTDQNACTSPQLVLWSGLNIERAKAQFWSALRQVLVPQYSLDPVQAVGKWAAVLRLAEEMEGRLVPSVDNLVIRVTVPRLDPRLMDLKHHSGFFVEYDMKSMEELLPMCTCRCQTIACLGVAPQVVASFLMRHAPRGVDRVVPVGRTMAFSLDWDGCDLLTSLSRVISVT